MPINQLSYVLVLAICAALGVAKADVSAEERSIELPVIFSQEGSELKTSACLRLREKVYGPDRAPWAAFEKRAIATVAQCPYCWPSPSWLGNFSPLPAIRDSGLWLKQHLAGELLNPDDLEWLDETVEKV